MKRILILLVLFFVVKHFAAPTKFSRFLVEDSAIELSGAEPVVAESETGHAEMEEKEEGGIEFHYSFGTKGFYVCILISLVLTAIAGIMSGLTVGLLSIDTLELEMKMIHGTDEQKKLAAKVLPLLHKHHYLLVTLLLCNACAMEALPIFLDAIVPAAWAIVISVTCVLFFGEIIPQAICTGPQQLKIASMVAPSVNFLMIVVGVVAYPISKILDCMLGEHHAIRYTNNDLKALIELHSLAALQETLGDPKLGGFGLQAYQTRMIQGAIDIQNHKIKEIMIPFSRVYSIRIGKRIDVRSAKKILKGGFSRIPVYMDKDRHAIIGYMLIKTLVGVDLSEGKTIRELIHESVVTLRRPLYVSPNEDIGGLLTRFKQGKSHMAIVTDNIKTMERNMKNHLDDDGSVIEDTDNENGVAEEKPKVLGIITLEDVIESALKEDILDEADYDIQNDPNFNIRLDRSMDAISQMEHPKIEANTNLHKVIQNKIREKLGRKKSELPTDSMTLSKQWFEMNDISESLLEKKPSNKQERLSNQIKDPEMSKSYSFFRNQKKI